MENRKYLLFRKNNMAVKQVIVMRKDLKMRRGKEISQGAHASCSFLAELIQTAFSPDDRIQYTTALDEVGTGEIREWLRGGFTKITVQVNSEEELMEVFKKAKDAHLSVYLITDSGKTEFNGVPTNTCLAIGPHEASRIDKITGELELY